jgi:hypothetical protein
VDVDCFDSRVSRRLAPERFSAPRKSVEQEAAEDAEDSFALRPNPVVHHDSERLWVMNADYFAPFFLAESPDALNSVAARFRRLKSCIHRRYRRTRHFLEATNQQSITRKAQKQRSTG